MATAVETAAICSEVTSDGSRPRVLASRSYQRSDQSGGGRVNTVDEPNDTAMVTTSGVIRNTTVKAAMNHTAYCDARSIAVMCCLPAVAPTRSSRQRC